MLAWVEVENFGNGEFPGRGSELGMFARQNHRATVLTRNNDFVLQFRVPKSLVPMRHGNPVTFGLSSSQDNRTSIARQLSVWRGVKFGCNCIFRDSVF